MLPYGYGGFNISATPTYRPAGAGVARDGRGVRGGKPARGRGSSGEAWHKVGTLANKQHVFDDFIAAAEYLTSQHYTRSARLGIHGRSNGGLLIGAVLTQRPRIFGVAPRRSGYSTCCATRTASANARQWSSDYGLVRGPDPVQALYSEFPGAEREEGVLAAC